MYICYFSPLQSSGRQRAYEDEEEDDIVDLATFSPRGRRNIQVEYDSDVDLELDVDNEFFKPRDGVDGSAGKRISIISVTSDDDADAARLRHLQRKQQEQQSHLQNGVTGDADDAVTSGPTTIQIRDEEAERITATNGVQTPEPSAMREEPEVPQENQISLPPPDFQFDNGVHEELIVPQDREKDMKKSGSIRSLREVLAAQKGKTPPPGRKERPKLEIAPSDAAFDNVLNGNNTAGTAINQKSQANVSAGVVPPAPPPPPTPPSANMANGHAGSKTTTTTVTTKTVYSKSSADNVDTSGVVVRKKDKKREDFRGSQKSIGTSKLAAQQEQEFPNEQIESIHDSLRDLDLYLKQQKDGDSVSVSSQASSKLEQFHFALTDESTPM